MADLKYILIGLLLGGTAFAAPAQQSDLERLRDAWHTGMAKIDQEYMTLIKKYEPVYLKNLQQLEAQFQKAGRLEPMLAVRNESKRFQQARRLDRGQLSDTEEVRTLQLSYLRATEKAALNAAQKITTLAQRYEKSLGALRVGYTKQNMIKSAIQVNEELEALQQNREVTGAGTLLAEYKERARKEREAALLTRQPATAPAAPHAGNQFKGSDKSRVNSRFDDLVKVILAKDYAKAEKLVDPGFVEEHGSNGVKFRIDILHVMLKVIDAYKGEIEVDKVVFDETGERAEVRPEVEYKFRKDKEKLDPVTFVKVQGDWYLQFEE